MSCEEIKNNNNVVENVAVAGGEGKNRCKIKNYIRVNIVVRSVLGNNVRNVILKCWRHRRVFAWIVTRHFMPSGKMGPSVGGVWTVR